MQHAGSFRNWGKATGGDQLGGLRGDAPPPGARALVEESSVITMPFLCHETLPVALAKHKNSLAFENWLDLQDFTNHTGLTSSKKRFHRCFNHFPAICPTFSVFAINYL